MNECRETKWHWTREEKIIFRCKVDLFIWIEKACLSLGLSLATINYLHIFFLFSFLFFSIWFNPFTLRTRPLATDDVDDDTSHSCISFSHQICAKRFWLRWIYYICCTLFLTLFLLHFFLFCFILGD